MPWAEITDTPTFISTQASGAPRSCENWRTQTEMRFFLAPAVNGWVSIYNDQCGQVSIGDRITCHLPCDIVSLMVQDDNIFCCWYYKNGQLIDHYNSCPDYFGEEVTEQEKEECKGHPDCYQDLLTDPKQIFSLQRIFNPARTDRHITIPQKDMRKLKKIQQLSEATDKFLNDPQAMLEMLEQIEDERFEEKFEQFYAPLSRYTIPYGLSLQSF